VELNRRTRELVRLRRGLWLIIELWSGLDWALALGFRAPDLADHFLLRLRGARQRAAQRFGGAPLGFLITVLVIVSLIAHAGEDTMTTETPEPNISPTSPRRISNPKDPAYWEALGEFIEAFASAETVLFNYLGLCATLAIMPLERCCPALT
jgi:hypothetical protein